MGAIGRSESEPLGVLVLGCGFLGGHVARGLADRGARVTGLSHSFAPTVSEVPGRLSLIRGDAFDRRLLATALHGVDEVIYCLGGLPPARAELEPERDAALVLDPLHSVLDALHGRPGIGFTYLSSGGAVYGNPASIPVAEDHPARPIGAYGSVRLAGEQIVDAARRRGGILTRILRCGNVYGEHQPLSRGQGAVGVFIDRISRGETIELFGDGETVRDYVYVGDLVEAIAQLLACRNGSALLNIGSGTGTSVNELVRLVEEALGRSAVVTHAAARPFDVRRVILDLTRLRTLIGYDPLGLAEGVARLVGAGYPGDDCSEGDRLELEPQLAPQP